MVWHMELKGAQGAPAQSWVARRVLALATKLEGDALLAHAWYRDIPIAEFDQLTASELVRDGRAVSVILFLRAIDEGRRG